MQLLLSYIFQLGDILICVFECVYVFGQDMVSQWSHWSTVLPLGEGDSGLKEPQVINVVWPPWKWHVFRSTQADPYKSIQSRQNTYLVNAEHVDI